MARPRTMAGRKMVSLPPELWERLDDFRFGNRLRTESDAIRRIIERGLAFGIIEKIAKDYSGFAASLLIKGQLTDDDIKLLRDLEKRLSKVSRAQSAIDWDTLRPSAQASVIEHEERESERLRAEDDAAKRSSDNASDFDNDT